VADLAEYVFESTPSQEFIKNITKNSGGNPFFILETFQVILDSPEKYSLQDPTSLPVSRNVHQLIQYRLKQLPTDAHEVLQTAAIMGSQFDVDNLEKASTFPTNQFVLAMEILEKARLIVRVPESKKIRYAFIHENIRECLLQDLPILRRKQLHNNVAYALEGAAQGQTEEIAITLAQHYEKAEAFERAFVYWVQGAGHAYQLTSVKEALNALEQAKKLADVAGNLDDQHIYELYAKWTEVTIYLDDPIELEKLSREMLDFGRERNSDLMIGAGLDRLSDACFANNQFEQGLEYVIEAAPYVQRSGDLYEILNVQTHRAAFLYMLGRFQEARPILYEVLERIPADQDARFRNLYCHIHYQIGIVEVLMGYPIKGLEFLKSALEHRHKAPAPLEVMSIYTAMGLAYFLKGEFRTGCSVCTTAIEMGEQLKYHRMLGYAYAYSALNGLFLGLLDVAWKHADRALYVGQKYGHHEISALAYRCMGSMYLRLEDYQSAIECFQQGLKSAGKHFVALEIMTLLGYTLFSIGKVEEGLEHLTNAYQLSSQSKLGSISVYAHSLLLFIRCLQGDLDSSLVEDIELALVNATHRSIKRAVMILKMPMTSVSQRPVDILKQFTESMQDASQMSDPIVAIGLLQRLIKFKKKENMSFKSEKERMDSILKDLAPRAEGMPFESAWQEYYEKMKEINET
jgi:tetratricopeptide (TPR) repeat protein